MSDDIRIRSVELGYDLQYRIYSPDSMTGKETYPLLFVTDGQWYIENGYMVAILDDLIATRAIRPIYVVFVDSRNPDRLTENRRNSQFMCNPDYAEFYAKELMPDLARRYPVSTRRENIGVLGLSFGGLNSACFGLALSHLVGNIGMQSPANSDHLELLSRLYTENTVRPLKVFFSVGTRNDNLKAARKFKKVLESKDDIDLIYTEHKGKRHNWENWRPLIDDALVAFFKTKKQ